MKYRKMVLWVILAVVAAWSLPAASQVSPEIGVSFAHATARHNGTWYQRAFPHTLKLNNPSLLAGLRYDVNDNWTTHADLIWFGHYSSDAWAIPNDPAYNPETDSCVGPCLPRAHYIGNGWIGAFKLTLGWHTQGPWQFGVNAGPIRYRTAWRLYVPDWYTADLQDDGSWVVKYRVPISTSDIRWAMGYTAGVSVTHGQWEFALNWYRDGGGFPGHNGAWPPIWRWHTTLGIVKRF